PGASAASVSKASHFQKQKSPIPVMVRFSAGSGLPTVPDTAEMPRGMAVKFTLADGSITDIVVLSFNGFPVATSEEFRDFLLAISASGPDAPKPTALENFLSSHPAEKGDKIDDPSIAWPDSRKTVELGTIAITKATTESHTADKLLFLPGAVVPGIEAADPMIAMRSAAYPISFIRRLKPQ